MIAPLFNFIGRVGAGKASVPPRPTESEKLDQWTPTTDAGHVAISATAPPKATSLVYKPVLNAITPTEEQKKTRVPDSVIQTAQEKLDQGDRGEAYLTLYRELGSEQILVQTQITTYTGIWGSGALTGNNMAREAGGHRYNIELDQFSKEIAQATIDAVKKDLQAGGTGRLSDDQFQSTDRGVWAQKGMAELFPGNIQFLDFWNHDKGDRGDAIFSPSTWNMLGVAARALVPNTSFLGLNQDWRNVANLVGKRPAEFAENPNYTIYGGEEDRFVTVVDNRTGFVESFWDKKPRLGFLPIPQLPDRPLDPDSLEYRQRHKFYENLGANKHGGQ